MATVIMFAHAYIQARYASILLVCIGFIYLFSYVNTVVMLRRHKSFVFLKAFQANMDLLVRAPF